MQAKYQTSKLKQANQEQTHIKESSSKTLTNRLGWEEYKENFDKPKSLKDYQSEVY